MGWRHQRRHQQCADRSAKFLALMFPLLLADIAALVPSGSDIVGLMDLTSE